jgi:hypothetical protein
MTQSIITKITKIISNPLLSKAIYESINCALKKSYIHLNSLSVWGVFKNSLDMAIRDIEKHPRGKLFSRLIQYGPHNPDEPEILDSDGKSTLSDPECGECVQFIFSHMVNRFKGELAELLALDPLILLIKELQKEKRLSNNIQVYWGDTISERRRNIKVSNAKNIYGGGFTKGADGLIIEKNGNKNENNIILKILGIIEVKSMNYSINKVFSQLNKHIIRLKGGVRLAGIEYKTYDVNRDTPAFIRIMIMPSNWKLSREWSVRKNDNKRVLVFPQPHEPPVKDYIEELGKDSWKIRLAWSQEVLSQAAYEMTFWYMSQVGKFVYNNKSRLPVAWQNMTSEEAGYNAIKMMLYYLQLRYLKKPQEKLAIKLYNIYSYGYPLGADSKVMLWPDDFIKNNNQ